MMKTILSRMTFSLKILGPDMVADPDEVRPEDSDDTMDGEMSLFLKNHNLLNSRRLGAIPGCGPWTSPMIDNPAFNKGIYFGRQPSSYNSLMFNSQDRG